MDIENLKAEIQKLVESMLEQKNFAGIEQDVENTLKSAETALNDMITKLADSEKKLAESLALIEGINKDKETMASEISTLKTSIENATSEKDAVVAELTEIKNALKEAEELKRMETRVAELSSLKVARSGDALDNQKTKVKGMTDEEFASYRDELVALRSDFIASEKTETASVDVPAEDLAGKKEEITTPPADIRDAHETASVLPGSVNDVVDRVRDLSDAFSKYMDERNNRAPKK